MNATWRTKTIRRYEVALPVPGVLGELDKAISYAQTQFQQHNGRPVQYDNDIQLAITDDEIVLWFEITTTDKATS